MRAALFTQDTVYCTALLLLLHVYYVGLPLCIVMPCII
jgi:hypothetical protein